MKPDAPFPWKSVAAALAVALPASAIAAFCVLTLLAFTAQDDIVILNGHMIGGTFDRVLAIVTGTVFGAVAVFAFLTCRRQIAEWRFERRGAHHLQ